MLELKQITKTYETSGEIVHALQGVDLTFRENEFVSILGPSGCGKTTLLNIMGGLDQYTTGDLVINGISTTKYKDADWDAYRNHSIGFVFQSYNLIPHQTVLANVELALTLSGVSADERRNRAIKALEDVGLSDQINKKPAEMSGGQMQRVAIARALINNPDILLADEPTGALDSETSVQIMKLLKNIAKNKLVIMVTHNPELAKEYSTRIVNLSDGLVTGDSNPCIPVAKDPNNPILKMATQLKNKSMSFKTALQLSLNNLMTKKARTILTSFAGSIGIIGIALILSVSNGFQNYIDKLEVDTLSSYPLTIESATLDMTSMLSAFAGNGEESSEKPKSDGLIHEQQIVANSFSSMGTNDLSSLKKYLDSKRNEINPLFDYYEYKYGIVPQIYASDMKYGVCQVSPDSLLSSYMNSMNSNFVSVDVFIEMIEDQELIDSQYNLAAGKWPTKYNELVLVLLEKDKMLDYLSYGMGLRDPKQFKKMMNKIAQGEEVEVKNEELKWTYDELMDVEFSLVRAGDTYRQTSGNIWEDMSDDDSYMKELIKNGEKLHIVGVAYPKEKNAASVMSTGIYYQPSLIEHTISEAANTDIVKVQKAHKDIDVFSNKSFESINEGTADGPNFSDIISVDEKKISSAFGGKLSANTMKKMIIKNTKSALKDINPETIINEVKKSATKTVENIIEDVLATGEESYDISEEQLVSIFEKNKNKGVHAEIINDLCNQGLDALEKEFGEGYHITGTEEEVTEEISKVLIELFVSESTQNKLAAYAEGIALQKTAINASKAIVQVAGEMGSKFNVDPSIITSAFKVNMDDEQITRMVSAYMTGGEEANYAENLRKLGYADLDKPTSIWFYLKDFESKDTFLDLLDSYNEKMQDAGDEDKVISYTDITGTMMHSVKRITNAVSYVLIAFVAISLIVSSIMIGVITYISVLERTKEIGILRAIGASKKDISRIFNAETVIVGFCAGVIGIVTSLLLIIPINKLLLKLTKVASLHAALPVAGAIILILISILLTYIAGLIPSKMASKKDPVVALRTE